MSYCYLSQMNPWWTVRFCGLGSVSLSHHLVGQQQDCFQTELAGAEVEQVLQTGAQQLHHHNVVVAFCSTPFNRWDSHCWERKRRAITYKISWLLTLYVHHSWPDLPYGQSRQVSGGPWADTHFHFITRLYRKTTQGMTHCVDVKNYGCCRKPSISNTKYGVTRLLPNCSGILSK